MEEGLALGKAKETVGLPVPVPVGALVSTGGGRVPSLLLASVARLLELTPALEALPALPLSSGTCECAWLPVPVPVGCAPVMVDV